MSGLVKASECAIFTQRRGHSLLMHLKCVSNSECGFCFPHFAFSFKLYVCQLLVTLILLSTLTNVFMRCGVGLYPSCMLWCWFLCFLEFGDYVFELWVNILVPHTTRLPTCPQAFLPTLQTTWTRSTYVFVYTVETLLQVQCQGHQVAKLHIQLKLYSSTTSCTKATGLWEINS